MFDPMGGLNTPKSTPEYPPKNRFSKFVRRKIDSEKYVSHKPVFRPLGAVSDPPGYENRVRDGLLHLLVMGNL